jgi:hypothetical protein
MMRLSRQCFVGLWLAFSLAVSASAVSSAPSDLDSDERLSAPVTLSRSRILVGELLEQLSQETGVTLEADEPSGPISGYELALNVSSRPARELMTALRDLYSSPPDRWYWERRGTGKSTRYVLHNTVSPAALQKARREAIDGYLLSKFQKWVAFFALPEGARAKKAAGDPELALLNRPLSAGLMSFTARLSPEQMQRVIQGERFTTPLEAFSPEQRAFVAELFQKSNLPPPADGGFPVSRARVERFEDTIMVNLGPLGAIGIVGGTPLRDELRARASSSWSAPEPSTRQKSEVIPAPGVPHTPEELALRFDRPDRILARLSRLSRRDFIYDRRPGTGQIGNMGRLAGTLDEVLANLRQLGLTGRISGEMLLFRPSDWGAFDGTQACPWSVAKELRGIAADRRGYLDLEGLLKLSTLTKDQLEYDSREFPDAGFVIQIQPVLRLVSELSPKERKSAERPEGSGWEDWASDTRSRVLALLTPQEARSARLLCTMKTDGDAPALRLFFGQPPVRAFTYPLRKCRQYDQDSGQFVDWK